jgi:hypothetical protein
MGQMGIMFLQQSRGQPEHPAIQDPEALLLKTAEHLTGQALGHGIRLNQD